MEVNNKDNVPLIARYQQNMWLWRDCYQADCYLDFKITRWGHTRAETEWSDEIQRPRPIILVTDLRIP